MGWRQKGSSGVEFLGARVMVESSKLAVVLVSCRCREIKVATLFNYGICSEMFIIM